MGTMKASEKLAKATREALDGSPEVRAIIEHAGEDAEKVKEVMFNMLWAKALMEDEGLREEIEDELFRTVLARIADDGGARNAARFGLGDMTLYEGDGFYGCAFRNDAPCRHDSWSLAVFERRWDGWGYECYHGSDPRLWAYTDGGGCIASGYGFASAEEAREAFALKMAKWLGVDELMGYELVG